MWKMEFERYLRSKHTLVVFLFLAAAIASFWISFQEKQLFVNELLDPSPDLNLEAAKEVVKNLTGLQFVFNFWFVSDFFFVFSIILLLWIGIFLSAVPVIQKETGQAIVFVQKCGYKEYICSIIKAQSLYICIVMFLTTSVMVLTSFFFGGISFQSLWIATSEIALVPTIGLLLVQTLFISIFAVLVNGISMLLFTWIQNRYIIQLFPLVGLSLLPMILSSTIGNIVNGLGPALEQFSPWNILMSLESLFQKQFQLMDSIVTLMPFFVYGILFAVLYYLNTKKYSEEYL